jgi:hypothetical protein
MFKIIIVHALINVVNAYAECSNYLGAFPSSGVVFWNAEPSWLIGNMHSSQFGFPADTILLYAPSGYGTSLYTADIYIDLPQGTSGYINMTYETITDCSNCFMVTPKWDNYSGYISNEVLQTSENKWANITYNYFQGSGGTHKVGLEISPVSTSGYYLAMRSILVTACYNTPLSSPPPIGVVVLLVFSVIILAIIGFYIIRYLRHRRFTDEMSILE